MNDLEKPLSDREFALALEQMLIYGQALMASKIRKIINAEQDEYIIVEQIIQLLANTEMTNNAKTKV